MKISTETRNLLKKVRSSDATEELENSILIIGDERIPIGGTVVVRFSGKELHLSVNYRTRSEVPKVFASQLDNWFKQPKSTDKKDFWSMEAVSESGDDIVLSDIFPPNSIKQIDGGSTTVVMRFHQMDFVQSPIDEERLSQLFPQFDLEQLSNNSVAPDDQSKAQSKEPAESDRVEFEAEHVSESSQIDAVMILPMIKLLPKNDRTNTTIKNPYHGTVSESKLTAFVFKEDRYECCLETVDGDLEIHIRFNKEFAAQISDEQAIEVVDGISHGIGYIHGCHPWPFFKSIIRDGKVLEKWIRPYRELTQGIGLPKSESRLFQDSDVGELISCAGDFFAGDSEISTYAKEVLYFFRQSDKPGTAYEIRLLAQSSLLEGLVADLWEEFVDVKEPALFRRLKSVALCAVTRQLSKRRSDDTMGLLRKLNAYLNNWRYWTLRERWQQTCIALDLPWDHFERVFRDWNHYRHPLAHGFKKKERPEAVSSKLIAYSRFSGAINILLARVMGFRGNIEKSFLEGTEAISLKNDLNREEDIF